LVQKIIAAVTNTPIAIGGPISSGLGGMVVDDIENYFDSGVMAGPLIIVLNSIVLFSCVGSNRVTMMRREEVQRHIAPVIAFVRVVLKKPASIRPR